MAKILGTDYPQILIRMGYASLQNILPEDLWRMFLPNEFLYHEADFLDFSPKMLPCNKMFVSSSVLSKLPNNLRIFRYKISIAAVSVRIPGD
jgi:hypothetical protein